jgi:hypothetical protein
LASERGERERNDYDSHCGKKRGARVCWWKEKKTRVGKRECGIAKRKEGKSMEKAGMA